MRPVLPRWWCLLALALWGCCGAGLEAADSVPRTWHMAPAGDDQASGDAAHPFASLARAQAAAAPGDTILLHGGTYRIREEQIMVRDGIRARVFDLDRSGRPGAPIRYWAAGDGTPVLDFSEVRPPGLRVHALHVRGSWLHLRGLAIVGVQVTMTGHTQSSCIENHGDDNIFEALALHDGQAIGFYLVAGSRNLVLNCDAYRNHDVTSENKLGGNTDGFGIHPAKGSVGNVVRGCRAWCNSDDGFDVISARESVAIEGCWSFRNGLAPDGRRLADGNGFKIGGWASTPAARLPVPMPGHRVSGCLSVANKANGFYANHHLAGNVWEWNTAFRDGVGFNMLERVDAADGTMDLQVPGTRQRLRGNLAYRCGKGLANLAPGIITAGENAFGDDLRLTDADFLDLDLEHLTAPRQADGSLPTIPLLHPAPGSPLLRGGKARFGCFPPQAP